MSRARLSTPQSQGDNSCRDFLQYTLGNWNGVDDVWVFAYGSLIWRPDFPWLERRQVTLRGYHRSLCLWSHDHRGSPETPGLVFGLDRGGCCRGVAFRIAACHVREAFQGLWSREMSGGAYLPRWVACRHHGASVNALAFLLNRRCDHYAGSLSEDRLLAAIQQAVGVSGPCLDYVLQTERALRDHGIDDLRLGALVRRLLAQNVTLPNTNSTLPLPLPPGI